MPVSLLRWSCRQMILLWFLRTCPHMIWTNPCWSLQSANFIDFSTRYPISIALYISGAPGTYHRFQPKNGFPCALWGSTGWYRSLGGTTLRTDKSKVRLLLQWFEVFLTCMGCLQDIRRNNWQLGIGNIYLHTSQPPLLETYNRVTCICASTKESSRGSKGVALWISRSVTSVVFFIWFHSMLTSLWLCILACECVWW